MSLQLDELIAELDGFRPDGTHDINYASTLIWRATGVLKAISGAQKERAKQPQPTMKPYRIEMLCRDGWQVLKEHDTEMEAVENYASHIERTPYRGFRLVRADLVDAHSVAVPGT